MDHTNKTPFSPTRSARALLVFLNHLLSQGVQVFISFFITPLILNSLGTEVFGAWKVINSTSELLTLGNFKPLGLLRLILAKEIANDNVLYKQQQIGAAINVLILTLPILLVLSCLLFHYRNLFIPASTTISEQIDLALIIAIIITIITPFLSVSDSIVSGLNLEYKRFGVSSVAKLVVAVLTYYIVIQGATLPWVVAVSSLNSFIPSSVSCFVIIHDVPWFKLIKPPRNIRRSFFKMNMWAFISVFFYYIFSSMDVVLIGFYFGVTTTATYSLTRSLVNFLFTPANSLISAGLAGVGDLIGRKELKTVRQLRSEQINTIAFASFIIGIIVMLFNASFVSLWVGEKHFGGGSLSKWIVVAAIIDAIAKTEGIYINASLNLKDKTFSLGISAIVYIGIIILFKSLLDLNVFPIAFAVSQMILVILYWLSLRDCLQTQLVDIARVVIRPFFIAAVLFYACTFIQPFQVNTWLDLIIHAAVVGIITLIPAWMLILQKNDRKSLINRSLRLLGK